MNQEDQSKIDAFATVVVRRYSDEKMQDVIAQARTLDVGADEQCTAVFTTALYEGARIAFAAQLGVEIDLTNLLRGVIEDVNTAIQGNDNPATVKLLEGIRAPVTGYFDEQFRKLREVLIKNLSDGYGIEKFLLTTNQPVDEIDHETVYDLGKLNVVKHPDIFATWAAVGDRPMQCRCPNHLIQEFEKSGMTIAQARDRCFERFPDEEEAFSAFGRYIIEYCRHTLQRAAEGQPTHVASIEPSDAGKMVDELLANLRLKPNGG